MKKTMLVAAGLILLAAIVLLPSVIKARSTRSSHPCNNNLRMIQGAKEFWAYTNGISRLDAIVTFDDILPYMKGHHAPVCNWTHTNSYTVGTLGEEPRCSLHGGVSDFRKPLTEKAHDIWGGL
jgi:hypothetical protein